MPQKLTCPVCHGKGTLSRPKDGKTDHYGVNGQTFSGQIMGHFFTVRFNADGSRFTVDGPDGPAKAAIIWTLTGGQA